MSVIPPVRLLSRWPQPADRPRKERRSCEPSTPSWNASRPRASSTYSASPAARTCPTYDALYDAGIRHVQCRHEQGAGHAAEGYAKASGKVGVALATSGPGATNLVTAIADAMMDSVPTVFLTGPGAHRPDRHGRLPGGRHLRHHDADRQALDHDPGPARDPEGDPRGVPRRAHAGARAPVLVDIPQDLSRADIPYEPVDERPPAGLPAHHRGQPKQIRLAAKALANARRPVIYGGGGDRERERVARSSASCARRTASRSPAR